MPDLKISGLTALTAADTADLLEIVDVSDTTMAATGTNKKITAGQVLASGLPGSFSTLAASGAVSVSTASSLVAAASMFNATGTTGTEASLVTASAVAARSALSLIQSRGTIAAPTASVSGDLVGFVGFKGFDGSATLLTGLIQGYIDDTVSAGNVPMAVEIITGLNSGGRSPRITVRSSGKVGINNTNPSATFDITGSIAASTTGKVGTTLGVGNATPSASGAGITFPATQSASTDPNTLDDYEEGTWTPVLGSTVGATGQAYSTQTGTYVKVGRKVTCTFSAVLTTLGTITGAHRITGLPFPSSATAARGNAEFSISLNLGVNVVAIQGRVEGNSTECLIAYRTAASASDSYESSVMWTATTSLDGAITYFV